MTARLEVIVGPMFSGKTERLISELHRAQYANKIIAVIKPARDTRTEDTIASRMMQPDGTTAIASWFPATPIRDEHELLKFFSITHVDVLAVDEAQFFPLDEPLQDSLGYFGRAVRDLLRYRKDDDFRIIVTGLDTDGIRGDPFGPIPGLLAIADKVEKLSGICMVCKAEGANHSQRLTQSGDLIQVGDIGEYQVRCRKCFEPPPLHTGPH